LVSGRLLVRRGLAIDLTSSSAVVQILAPRLFNSGFDFEANQAAVAEFFNRCIFDLVIARTLQTDFLPIIFI
jgi:hypothetical protein